MPATADDQQPPDVRLTPLPAICSRRAVMFGAAGIVGTLVSACTTGAKTGAVAATSDAPGRSDAASSAGQPSRLSNSPASSSGAAAAPSSTRATAASTSTSGATAAATPTTSPRPRTDPTPSPAHTPAPTPAPATSAKPAGTVLAALDSVPTGGSLIVKGPNGPVALARPSASQVVAHTAICTHMGCTVGAAGSTLKCPCHGSQYNAFTGAVLQGPAPDPLGAITVRIDGGKVVTP